MLEEKKEGEESTSEDSDNDSSDDESTVSHEDIVPENGGCSTHGGSNLAHNRLQKPAKGKSVLQRLMHEKRKPKPRIDVMT